MKYKAIIFDADGMIVHGERFSSRLEREYGISKETTKSFFTNEFQFCLIGKLDLKESLEKHINNWGWVGSVNDLLEYWFSEKYNEIDNRFESVIAELRKEGIKCYLATNNEKYRTSNLINDRGIGIWFDGVFSSADVGSKKPDHDFFDYIIKKLDVDKKEVVFWDDDMENIEGAKSFGLDTQHYSNFEEFAKMFKK